MATKGEFAVETWPIDKPQDYPKNARVWTSKAIAKVAAKRWENLTGKKAVLDAGR